MTIEPRPEPTKSQGRGRSNSLPSSVVDYLKAWLMSPEHINHPYPTEQEKAQMVADTGIELKRLNNWFVNNRIRYWKPRMEALQRQKRDGGKAGNPVTNAKNAPTTNKTSNLHHVSSSNSITDLQLEAQTLPPPEAQVPSSASSFVGIVSDASTSSTEGSEDGTLSDVLSAIKTIQVRQTKNPPKHKSRNPLKRKREEYAVVESSPRSKYSNKNIRLWRNVCESSSHHEALPSLDEAACLFGFSIDQ
ncbi:unnamed protein product [Cylindrotheca closterium]|uniref:Homeobox domain-containing protein n=1 Tax=Cylindrotheca closterium TaxID=2856 RepID=A0AAD2FCQ0_9STRA|nr:unnamed protein product [Cylindrotheca closterium]